MTITSAKVVPGCISCKNCENICPEIFKVNPTSRVISDKFNQNAIKLLMAEKMCPVNVIKVEKEGSYDLEMPKAKLTSKKYLTSDVVELVFSCENFEFTPWQYISLQMNDIRWDFTRSYSIASGDSKSFTLTVKLLKKWRGSNYLKKLWERSWKNFFRKNTIIEYMWALWDFKLQNTQNRKIMIATGTGIAPMIAMLESLPEDIQKIVVFGVKYEQDLYYIDTLKNFKNIELRLCVSRPGDSYVGNVWRVTDYIHDIVSEDEVYVCWNPDMVHSVVNKIIDSGHNEANIFHEDFTLAAKPNPIWKSILFEGNLPWIMHLHKILIYLWAIWIPVIYFLAIQYQLLGFQILNTTLYQFLFDMSWYTVVFVMIIRPLADLFPKLIIFRRLVVLRKWLWIISAAVIVSALLAKWIQNPFTFNAFFTSAAWIPASFSLKDITPYYPIIARLSEVTAIILLLTSNNISQKLLWVWWKRIQKTSYIYFISWWLAAARWSPDKFIYETIVIVWILWLLAKLWVKIWK